jgi:uncharacterized protein
MSKQTGISKSTVNALKKNFLTEDSQTADGYNNFSAKLGLQTDNLSSKGHYTLGNMLSRNHVTLEAIYRTSWIAGQVVDTVAEDMTKEGIAMYSTMSPDHVQKLQSKMTELAIWRSLCSCLKWSRLYGGAIAVILTEGADYSTPLDVSKIGKNAFKGLVVFDRWQIEPSYNDLVTELCPDIGQPKYYQILAGMETMGAIKVHYSRVIRFDGIEMPYYQKKMDNLWGMSVIERMYDRLLAFDSATTGAAQLMYKAYLRVVQVKGLRTALAMGGKTEQAVIKQFQYIRLMQSMEGITLLDSEDTFATHNYTFGGVADVLREFGQQISGACNIPLVRLFGQSPAGFSTGDTDLRNYYDGINKNQEAKLRLPVRKVLEVMSMSEFGSELPEDFEFEFNSLWEMSEQEKSQIASADTNAINTAFQSGLITQKIGMKELQQQSRHTGRYTNIEQADIDKAQVSLPEHQGMGEGSIGEENKIAPSPNQTLNIADFKKRIAELKRKFPEEPKPEEDDAVNEEQTIEQLEEDLETFGEKSIQQLEKEITELDDATFGWLENELEGIVLSKEKTLGDLEEELKSIGLSDTSIELLEQQLKDLGESSIESLEAEISKMLSPKIPKKMSMNDSLWARMKKLLKG